MKKIIDGVVYDTDVSKELASYYNEVDKETIKLFLCQDDDGMYYFLSFENGNVEPLGSEYDARHWVLCNLDADSCGKIFDVHYLVDAKVYVDNKKIHYSFYPKSQTWNDIIACFEETCDSITRTYPFLTKYDEWYINACQPACHFVDSNGNEVVVYVYCSD